MKSVFQQIPLEGSSKEKFAFTVPAQNVFKLVRLPFGLHNLSQTQQRPTDKLFLAKFNFGDIMVDTEKHIQVLSKTVYK